MSWHTLLVLGGIGSGRSEFAESLVTAGTGPVARVSAGSGDTDLTRLAGRLAETTPDETVVVDLTEWPPGEFGPLVEAVRAAPGRVVLVSAEVGLAPPPSAAAGRGHVQARGDLNRALAQAVDAVVLVVAGQPISVKGGTGALTGVPARAGTAPAATGAADGLAGLRSIPTLDDDARAAAAAHLAGLGGIDLGALAAVVTFAAAAQGTAEPATWRAVRALVLHGDHSGGAAAGAADSATMAARLRAGAGPLATLAGAAGVSVQLVETAAAAPIEAGPAMTEPATEAALAHGWQLAGQAVDEGVDAIVLGSVGAGADTAAVAVVSALATGAEPAGLIPRVRTAGGRIDDRAWIARCAAVRDAVHRFRGSGRTAARSVLAELGGPDLATAAGIILGAAARRTPVLLDGPVGCAAALAARGLAAPARHWCLLVDHNRHPAAVRASEVLGLTPLLDLHLDLGEGAPACAALPLLRAALTLPSTQPPAAAPEPAVQTGDGQTGPGQNSDG